MVLMTGANGTVRMEASNGNIYIYDGGLWIDCLSIDHFETAVRRFNNYVMRRTEQMREEVA